MFICFFWEASCNTLLCLATPWGGPTPTLGTTALGYPSSGQTEVKYPLGCLSIRQKVVKCPTTFCVLVPHRIQLVPFLLILLLPVKHPESASEGRKYCVMSHS